MRTQEDRRRGRHHGWFRLDLGNSVLRVEDPTLLTGEGKYVDDLAETGMLHVSLVRSSVAHGTIDSVDIGDAASMPGVAAVYHAGNDLGMPRCRASR